MRRDLAAYRHKRSRFSRNNVNVFRFCDLQISAVGRFQQLAFSHALQRTGENADDLAVSELQIAIKLDPSDSRAMYNLATYYYQDNKNLPLAERYSNKALRVEPNNQNYKYLLALIYQNLGQVEKSQRLMRELQPNQ